MLVLTRRTDESITLGDPTSAEQAIEITVVEVRGDQVRIGITAPRDVAVHRQEIWEQVQEENRAASKTPVEGLPAVAAGKPASSDKPGSTVGMTLDEIRRRGKRP